MTSPPDILTRRSADERLVLHVGCGKANPEKLFHLFRRPGWREVRFDISPENAPDILGDMLAMVDVPTGSVDGVFSSHNIEHVFAHEAPIALAEFNRVLRPGGIIVVTCPDIAAVARRIPEIGMTGTLYDRPSGPVTPLDVLYGYGEAIAAGRIYMAHKTGFDATSLTSAFEAAGFVDVRSHTGHNFDLWCGATKAG